jgi:predicted ATPase
MPELLRVKGNLLRALPPALDAAEACFTQSLALSRRQGARAWELRAAIDLADLWAAQGKHDRAKTLLQPAFAQFGETIETADLKAAEHLLAALE